MQRIKINTDKTELDMKIANKRFDEIIKEVKEQGGSVQGFIVECVLFRVNSLKNNPLDSSQYLEVEKSPYAYNLFTNNIATQNIPTNVVVNTVEPQQEPQVVASNQTNTDLGNVVELDNDSFFDDDDDF